MVSQTSENSSLSVRREEKNPGRVVVGSFPTSSLVSVWHTDWPEEILHFPVGKVTDFFFEEIEGECRRLCSIRNSELFMGNYRSRKLILYVFSSVSYSLVKYFSDRGNYAEYHVFTSDNSDYFYLRGLEKNSLKKIRVNTPENEMFGMLCTSQNEYGELYDNYNDDRLVIVPPYFGIAQICGVLNEMPSCFLSMKYNWFTIWFLEFVYLGILRIEIISVSRGYVLLRVSRDTRKNTFEDISDRIRRSETAKKICVFVSWIKKRIHSPGRVQK